MLMLAMDTSTSAITVALHDGSRVLAEHSVLDARRHTEHLAPGVVTVLSQAGASPAEVTDVAVGTGPGPFTGLRVGVVTALTFAHARGIPVHGVCSLDALAHAVATSGEFLVVTDARRKEVYHATYAGSAGRAHRLTDPAVQRPADLAAQVRSLPTVGRGPLLYPDLFPHGAEPLDVSAAALAEVVLQRLAGDIPMPVEPLYLRRPDAMPTSARKAALQEARGRDGAA